MRRDQLPIERENIYSTLLGYDSLVLKQSLYYPLRAYFADDFIEQIIYFRAFERKFEELYKSNLSPSANYQAMSKWCIRCFLNFPVMLDIYDLYVNVKNKLCTSGIDITYQHSDNSLMTHLQRADYITPSLHDYTTRLKLCIYHGFKMNLAELQSNGRYRMNWGGLEFSYSFFGTDKTWKKYEAPYTYQPQRLLFYKAQIMSQQHKYSLSVLGISILDGFI